ncbi:MAG: hypothetical protein O7E51_16440 [Acidobacteria bacterium]|nr:hypothetical protein [Acidobacteriota bacterium]
METQASDLKWRLRRIERTVPYLFRLCAILAAFQVLVFLIAVEGLTWRQMGVYSQPPEGQKTNSGFPLRCPTGAAGKQEGLW